MNGHATHASSRNDLCQPVAEAFERTITLPVEKIAFNRGSPDDISAGFNTSELWLVWLSCAKSKA